MAKKQEKMQARQEKKRSEDDPEIKSQFTSFQALLDALPQNVYQKDRDGRIIFCNKSLLATLNRAAEDIYGKTDYDFYPKELAEKYAIGDKQVLETGEKIDLIEENKSPETGLSNFVQIVKTPVRNESGDIVGTQGIWWDVTERVEAENKLRESQTRSQVILDGIATPLVILKIDDGKILYANEYLAELVRTPLAELIGYQAPNFYHRSEDSERVVQMIHEHGIITNLELHLQRADGELFWAMLSAKALLFDNVPAMITTFIDISERKQVAEAYEDALEATELQAHRLSLLNELGAMLNAATDVNDIYRITAKHIGNIVSSDQASIALLNADGDQFEIIMLRDEISESFSMEAANTVMNLVVQEGRLIRLPKDVPMEDYEDGRARLDAGLNSAVCMPLIVQGAPMGVLNIAKENENAFQESDIGFMHQIASLVANAIESHRLDERSRLLAAIVENHPDFIGVGSLVGQALYVNPAGLRMMGLSADYDVTQMIATDFYDQDSAKLLMDEAIPIALRDGAWTGESNLRRADESTLSVDQIININYDAHNNPVSFAITMHDITERLESEAELARQSDELAIVAQVSTAVASTLDTKQLLQEVVDLTKSSFNMYHAHIYLLNENEDTLLLTAGAGEAGAKMVAEKRTIPLDTEHSLVARAARTQTGIIVNDVHADADFLPHPTLPDTQAEMAVPMIAGERLLGILDIQADSRDRFSEQDLIVQATLAAQISIALINAQTFEESEKARQQLDVLTRRLTREGWEDYMDSLTTDMSYSFGLESDGVEGEKANGALEANLIQSLNVQGEDIGQLALTIADETVGDASEIVAAVASSLSAHLENLRLTEQTQVALSETESLYNTSIQLNAATNLEQILESAFELPQKMGASSAALYTFELDDNGLPEWATAVAVMGRSPLNKGERTYIPDFALANVWLNDPKGAILIADVVKNRRLDKKTKALFKKEKTRALTVLPLVVGNRKIGQIVFRWQQSRSFSKADQRIFNAIATQSASIVYSRLLFRQTDEALSETAALYQGSADLNTANSYDEVLKALRHHTLLGQDSATVSVNYFNRPWIGDDVPERVDVLAYWNRKHVVITTPLLYEIKDFPSLATLLSPTKVVLVDDIARDKRLGKGARHLFGKVLKAESVVFIPLLLGGHWLGYVSATYAKRVDFQDQETRRAMALSRQAAVSIENNRLLQETSKRAQREQSLRQIAAKVRGSADVDVVLRTAVEEVGKVLGRQAYVYLQQDGEDQAAVIEDTNYE